MKFNVERVLYSFLLMLGVMLLYKSAFTSSYSYGPNYENVSVDTRINITNAPPVVLIVEIDEGNATITLNAGLTRTIYCNATIRDWNGWDDINITNATLWDNNNANEIDPLNNTMLYRNTSCTNVSNDGQYLSYWRCAFDVWYYANNGSDWRCNVTTVDLNDFTASNYNTTTISPLYALNISVNQIDYGNVPVEGTSDNQTADVINFGNMNINTSVWGYGATPGDGLAFNCSISGNITLANERFSINASQGWSDKTSLSGSSQLLGFTVDRQTNATPNSNTSYWQVYVPVTNEPAGLCTGTVVFEASIP